MAGRKELQGSFAMTGGGGHGLRWDTIHDLIDRVNGFPFASSAAQNKDSGNQKEL